MEELTRKHILYIDDDPIMLRLVKSYLIDTYDVGVAVNGRTAYKFLETKHTDLILLDYEMPEESGPEVLEKLRAMEKLADTPIVFLSGHTDEEKIVYLKSLPVNAYLEKPVNRDKLLELVGSLLNQ